MASQLEQLKAQIAETAEQANSAVTGLSQFKKTFASQQEAVARTIGGSSQKRDQEVIAALDAADTAVGNAMMKLQQAAKIANDYSATL